MVQQTTTGRDVLGALVLADGVKARRLEQALADRIVETIRELDMGARVRHSTVSD